jgi:hypothetical protein
MHSVNRFALGLALMTTLTPVWAASSVDVSVKGSIIPGGCTPTLSSAEFDHGKISAQDLDASAPTSFANRARDATLTIACEAPTLYGVRGIDNRAGSALAGDRGTYFGLGHTPAGERIGAHLLRIVPARSSIDNKPAFLTLGSEDGRRWTSAESEPRSVRANGVLVGLADAEGVNSGPVPIKSAILGLSSSILIAPTEGLTLTEEVALDGAATLELVYL